MTVVDRLRYDRQVVDSMLWKFDSAVEQVRESKGESEIAASAGAFVGGGLEGKAEQAARSVAEGRSDYLLRLGAYKEALLKVKSKVEGADADSADGFKRPPRWRNEIV